MSEDRETHEIITPLFGHVIVLKSWITGREKQKIDGAMFSNIETVGEDKNMKPKMSNTMLAGQENASIEAVVISVDGSTENVLDRILDMRVKDFEFINGAVARIVEGDFDEKKEPSLNSNITEPLTVVAEESMMTSSI